MNKETHQLTFRIKFLRILALFTVFGFLAQRLPAQTPPPLTRTEIIALLDYIALESELTRLYQEDSLLLEDIYNRIENHLDPGLLDKPTRDRILGLFNNITDFKVTDLRRERIRQIRDRARARAVQSAIPSPVFFLSLTSRVRDPVSLIINLVGMTAQSVTSYLSAAEQAELQFFEASMELDIEQEQAVNRLRGGMFDHMAEIANTHGLRGNDTVSRADIGKFVSNKVEGNLTIKLRTLLDLQNVYEKFYPYWLELANTYHAAGQFRECISAIQRYEEIRAPIFRRMADADYVETLLRGVDALSHIHQNNRAEYSRLALDYLKKIEENAPDNHWLSRYGAALAYIDIAASAARANRSAYLNNAFALLRGNVRTLTLSQREMLYGRNDGNSQQNLGYLDPVPSSGFLGFFENEETKRREVELPPFSDALLLNCRAIYGLMEEINLDPQGKAEISGILNDALYTPVFRKIFLSDSTYSGDLYSPVRGSPFSAKIHNTSAGKILGRVVGGVIGPGFIIGGVIAGGVIGDLIDPNPPQSVELSFPVVFLGPPCSVNLKIVNADGSVVADEKGLSCEFENITCIVKEVERKRRDGLNDFMVRILAPLPNKVKLDKDNDYRIELDIVTEAGTQGIIFHSPAKHKDFTEYKVLFE